MTELRILDIFFTCLGVVLIKQTYACNLSIMESNEAVCVVDPLLDKVVEHVGTHLVQAVHQQSRVVVHCSDYNLNKARKYSRN